MPPKTAKRAGRRTERVAGDITEETAEGLTGGMAAQEAEQADDELAELSLQLPDGALLTLYRMVDGGEKEFLEEQAVAGFTLAGVASRFGGGRYIIYMKRPDPEVAGKYFRAGSKRFRIGGPARYNVVDASSASPVVAGAAETEKLQRAYGDLIQQSIRQSAESAQLMQGMQLALLKSMTERPAAAPDTSLELLKTILPSLIAGKQAGPSIADVIALADKMAHRNSPTAQLKETLELVTTARELGGGGEAAAPPWMGIAARALDVIGRAVSYNPRQLPAGEVVDETTVPALPAPAAAEVPTVPESSHPLLKWLAPQIPGLVAHATADHDPDTYAGVLVDNIPETHWPDVLAFLESPDFAQQLQQSFPMTQAVAEWFEELRSQVVDRLRELMKPPAAETPAT